MISSLSSGVLSVTPATRDRPRVVTREMIEVFERNTPALRGIGAIMVDLGVWVVENKNSGKDKDPKCTSAKAHLSDIQRATYVTSFIDGTA